MTDAQLWFITGATARSFDCGCSSCLKQFNEALDDMERHGLTRLTDEERREAIGRHPK